VGYPEPLGQRFIDRDRCTAVHPELGRRCQLVTHLDISGHVAWIAGRTVEDVVWSDDGAAVVDMTRPCRWAPSFPRDEP
jgi:hypothetical protein